MPERSLSRCAARLAVALVPTLGLLAAGAPATAASIVPVAAERTRVWTHYEDGIQISSTVYSDTSFDPIEPPTEPPFERLHLVSEFADQAVTASLRAQGEEYYASGPNEDVERSTLWLEFELSEDTAYSLHVSMASEQLPAEGARPELVLGDAFFALSFFDPMQGGFIPQYDFSALGCLNDAPCSVFGPGISDGNGGFALSFDEAGALPAGRYRLHAGTESWGYPSGNPDSPYWDEGLASRSSIDLSFTVPEPGSGALVGLGLVAAFVLRRRPGLR